MRTTALASSVCLLLLGPGCPDDDTGKVLGDGTGGTQSDSADNGTSTATDSDEPTASDGTTTTAETNNPTTFDITTPPDTTAQETDGGPQQICFPSEWLCSGNRARHQCNFDGTDFFPDVPCPEDQTCTNGLCVAKCPNDPKFGVYVGCEFWATDLPNYPDPTLSPTPENAPWAIVVSNPSNFRASVSFEMPPLFPYEPADPFVDPGQSKVFLLPNINVQGTSLMPKGVHITASQPVTVHQFNPYEVKYSNDASLLMPDPMLGNEYTILSWPTSPLDLIVIPGFPTPPNQNGYFTVIAAFDDTQVTIQPSAHVRASGAIPELNAGQIHTLRINRGDVLSIQADPKTLGENGDITGSRVTANKPISVFGGHEEAVIGEVMDSESGQMKSACCADHLEEQMLPQNLAGTAYLAIKSPPRGTSTIEDDFWRIQALEPNVTITTNPPQPGANNVTISTVGGFIQIQSKQSFEIAATGKIQIGQYLIGRDATEDFTGDPSLVVMIASERFRKDYVFTTPDYSVGGFLGGTPDMWATIVKKTTATVMVDGAAVPEASFTALGSSGWEYAYHPAPAGVHQASSAEPFGLYVYGYNNAVSFSYIGGLAMPGE